MTKELNEADLIAEGIRQEKLARRTTILTTMGRKNEQILSLLADAKRQIETMVGDATSGSMPRYGNHLATTARQIAEIQVAMETLNNSL